ncbi:isoprenoid synthase domain-containing protein [Lyophyllum atratum]|nr:isoprenoid synthase domain-containing protein [Lyophyllum atratum]
MSKYDNLLQNLSTFPTWSPQNESALLEPFTYITSNPGKEIRGQLIEAFNIWLNVPATKLSVISRLVNMLHAASLLVDDIEDDSQLRRGQPVAHKIYGVPQTINTANYVFFLAYQELFTLRAQSSSSSSSPSPGLDAIVTEELLSLHRGQGLEILWRDSLSCPSEEEYISMVNNKTGGLLRIGIKLMMACSTSNTNVDYVPLVNLIGIYFQIRDDLMNLQSTEYTKNKGFAEDLTEGKFSFPIVHAIHADTTNRQVLNVLQKRPSSPTLKIHTINYLAHHTRSFAYTHSVLASLEAQIRAEIGRLGGNEGLEGIMERLSVRGSRRGIVEVNYEQTLDLLAMPYVDDLFM